MPLRVLIVDDELWAALDMEWVVQTLGHEVVGPATTAEKAVEFAGRSRPDLVLMDIRLADDSDGVAAAIEIRQRFGVAGRAPERRAKRLQRLQGNQPWRQRAREILR